MKNPRSMIPFVNPIPLMLVLLGVLLPIPFVGPRLDAAEPTRPNVLFLIVDDLNCRIGCYGDPFAKTPHIDRLASRGVRFDHAYCNFPVCNPSRCSVMSGLYPTTTEVLDNRTWLVMQDGHPTLQRHFAAQGYAIGEFGKVWHTPLNNGLTVDSDVPKNMPGRFPWYSPAQRREQRTSQPNYWTIPEHFSHYRYDPPTADEVERLRSGANLFGPVPVGKQTPDISIADEGIMQLNEWKDRTDPFFLAIGFLKPHVPLKAPQSYFDQHVADSLPLPIDFANQPSRLPGTRATNYRVNLDLFADRVFNDAEARQALRAYYACVTYSDDQIGRVLSALQDSGKADNTIVVLWGDHGWHLSEKGMWAKGTLFDIAARAPLIIVDPRQRNTAGKVSSRIVQFVDLYPTLADLCGLPLPKALEGKSVKPLLDDPDAEWNATAFTIQSRGWSIGRRMRTERWAYTEWDGDGQGAMLFDHDKDPHEVNNLAADPEYADVVAQLQQRLRASRVGQSMMSPRYVLASIERASAVAV